MNEYTEYPVLMWMLTIALLSVVLLGAVIPLVAGLTSLQVKRDSRKAGNV
ncbi:MULTISPECIES: hypothetical protein [Leucobacter]|uniref:Uncharacterized protein n=1 Tax=Leucobacter chromiiresistens TaxID=1079994 RepID=A0A1H0YJL3_9MICO|nr:hypothetical protein [Leucobacter chromiiresistens]SDQ15425.1 hypothetical protein SAMN04488565_0941 [Leucobacter chromiiresistens]